MKWDGVLRWGWRSRLRFSLVEGRQGQGQNRTRDQLQRSTWTLGSGGFSSPEGTFWNILERSGWFRSNHLHLIQSHDLISAGIISQRAKTFPFLFGAAGNTWSRLAGPGPLGPEGQRSGRSRPAREAFVGFLLGLGCRTRCCQMFLLGLVSLWVGVSRVTRNGTWGTVGRKDGVLISNSIVLLQVYLQK